MLSTAAPKPPVRGKNPALAIFWLPPMCSGAALVLMTYRMGFGGAGDAMTVLTNGLAQPQVPGQLTPMQLFGMGDAIAELASCLIAARILSDMAAVPVLTT